MNYLLLAILAVILTCSFFVFNAFAVFYKEDFQITKFGLLNGSPFIQVLGQAGRSFSIGGGDESYYAYTFVTDKGIFSSTVSLGSGSPPKPSYGVERIEVGSFIVGACISEKTATGTPKFSGNLAQYIPKNLVFSKVSNVYTYQVSADDPDSKCPSGKHIIKIFSLK